SRVTAPWTTASTSRPSTPNRRVSVWRHCPIPKPSGACCGSPTTSSSEKSNPVFWELMGFNCGIVGLPNVGKSTIFNALTHAGAQAANYPFCTIDPNIGIVPLPDERLQKIAQFIPPQKLVPTTVEFVDIAGLVKGASKGEGLGNQFLGNIKNT